ncbi:uncharacterized protein BO72DRAFT_290883 [Aspergillus fijiensis CBS 313.89]|uniref:Uncharacterized protein n=1 Tax=Aspergillus fijiensis CBS 313.89 TaxID=1448319 RepID=A0A8G1RHW8_9EURO|nr:uncharacterized protein BO72DRAFT_290883 [Aspergillus fijiensis CBS 313.89]RAK72085.1 hypothetical protein BO72DRAFT_290883 [Aspergillus fijiensis CBS 313.89]
MPAVVWHTSLRPLEQSLLAWNEKQDQSVVHIQSGGWFLSFFFFFLFSLLFLSIFFLFFFLFFCSRSNPTIAVSILLGNKGEGRGSSGAARLPGLDSGPGAERLQWWRFVG